MSSKATKVAVITGGASGMGLGVARALAARGGWQVHILDVKEEEGQKAAGSLSDVHFHKVDLTEYADLGRAIQSAFTAGGNRLDFVFANAGIIERASIFDSTSDSLDPPPEPNFLPMDVNLRGCINTIHIGRHYINKSPEKGSIVITGSAASVYPSFFSPIYTASKFGILGFVRAVAGHYQVLDGIRINALLPGAVRTNLFEEETWNQFPDGTLTSMDLIAKVVLGFVDGGEIVDSKGVRIPAEKNYGQAIVASAQEYFIIPENEYCDEFTAQTMEHTRIENQAGMIKK
ncbi:hypothetical protein BJ166DRAFT_531149 [Pestalotiopsis sp. NC0098]|nr:hypothetical protein BJ166DRAFT_531149 [Pestalotiopsis sp. NC0098]